MTASSSDSYLRTVQYGTPGNLQARVGVHVLFSTNKKGWPNWLFEKYEVPESAEILELGCGTGTIWESNAHRVPSGWRLTLTDFSSGMIGTVKETLGGKLAATYAVADAQSLPFPDGGYDAVMAHHMLYHVPNKPKALGEIARVLRKGGKLYAGTNGPGHLRQLWDLIRRFTPEATSTVDSQSFDLINGPAQVGAIFERVTVEEYPDSLEVTQARPLIDYIRSVTTLDEVSDDQLEAMEEVVIDVIRSKGSFHIDKHAGLITASMVSS